MITEYRKQYIKNWKKKHKKEILEYQRGYYAENKETYRTKYRCHMPRPVRDNYLGSCGIGRKYELIAKSVLRGSVPSKSFQHPFDLMWNGMKIDVKMRNIKSNAFCFSTSKTCTAEYFLCFCVDKEIKYILLVTRSVYGNGFYVTHKNVEGKYKKYLLQLTSSNQVNKPQTKRRKQ